MVFLLFPEFHYNPFLIFCNSLRILKKSGVLKEILVMVSGNSREFPYNSLRNKFLKKMVCNGFTDFYNFHYNFSKSCMSRENAIKKHTPPRLASLFSEIARLSAPSERGILVNDKDALLTAIKSIAQKPGSPNRCLLLHPSEPPVFKRWLVDYDEDIFFRNRQGAVKFLRDALDDGALLLLYPPGEKGQFDDGEAVRFAGGSFKVIPVNLDDSLKPVPVRNPERLSQRIMNARKHLFLIGCALPFNDINSY